ncbi:hypothetical protein PHYBLDRAFT_146291 [Phycomyces blakesleeanus NRRL 1555(-)]|uniref:Uncharacterized protein n=1 Tax=Phycomyces blakesleeanus (strain ATCC 8743b / DSM 1359 / FGSC 10004 / NBRC 33097 / NRRL 1555) TaxID=763407 RepID=A0A162PHT3_PHYB8|nr:hypothetical protein PHYBLDRAFT_146291 [Phycomyces blakesleeanus NRRL 1555(-)]OAD72977.1 hypothetical protein PHYBLDRAFT_146291 [Phycomyces blakesleeanus NRRL 1555(-)]|eukprot:XP_018291017.1 hypothetical protein PHYBLDRAFT_146291 [Phycomyces blakesleeanus NRRL 1555(-)]
MSHENAKTPSESPKESHFLICSVLFSLAEFDQDLSKLERCMDALIAKKATCKRPFLEQQELGRENIQQGCGKINKLANVIDISSAQRGGKSTISLYDLKEAHIPLHSTLWKHF